MKSNLTLSVGWVVGDLEIKAISTKVVVEVGVELGNKLLKFDTEHHLHTHVR